MTLASSTGSATRAELAEYLEGVAQRLESGEQIDFDAEAAQHPEHAARLRELWPALQVLVSLGGRSDGSHSAVDGAEPMRQLGEFRIVRELGRGGMGVVYEAEQQSLGRRVALKVLPFAAVLDPRQLARFQNEARAAASLHHTNIVPVFSVGCELGVHYYAMQLIDGRSLADVVRERNRRKEPGARSQEGNDAGIAAPQAQGTPNQLALSPEAIERRSLGRDSRHSLPAAVPESETLRALLDTTVRPAEFIATVARLGIQAAEALQHSHEVGIVHRDIKPSNLLLDERGQLWVTDFGLARLGTDAGVTMTGDVLGTLRYMSPEQAESRNSILDHRTDIYSLGATLYELATDRPVVRGQERAEILREIAEQDPASPRKFTPGIPQDLETILLKCLDKEPSARYASAMALAEDLRRFLEQRPIAARRPSLAQRGRKLLARHRALVRTGVVAVVLSSLAIAGVSVWQQRRVEAALAHSETQRKAAETGLAVAHDSFHAAHQSVDRLVQYVRTMSEHDPKRDALLEDAHRTFDAFMKLEESAVASDSQWAQYAIGRSAFRRADIERLQKRDDAATASYHKAIDVLGRLEAQYADWYSCRENRAIALKRLGELQQDAGRQGDAEQTFAAAAEEWEELTRRFPNDHRAYNELGAALNDQAQCMSLPTRAVETIPLLERAIECQFKGLELSPGDEQCRRFLINHYLNLAHVHGMLGRHEDVRSTVALIAQMQPIDWRDYSKAAEFLSKSLDALVSAGNYHSVPVDAWLADMERMVALAEPLARGNPEARLELASRYNELGNYLATPERRLEESATAFQRGLDLLGPRNEARDERAYLERVAMLNVNRAGPLILLGKHDEGIACFDKCLKAAQELIRLFPEVADYKLRLQEVQSRRLLAKTAAMFGITAPEGAVESERRELE